MMDHPLRTECCVHGQACMCDKGKIPNEYPFSFLAHLLLHIKETGISRGIQCSLNGSSFNVHKDRTPKHTQQAHTNSNTLDTLLSTQWSDLFRQSSRRQRGWRAGKLMNAQVWTNESAICVLLFFCSQERLKPLAPIPCTRSSLLPRFSVSLFPETGCLHEN